MNALQVLEDFALSGWRLWLDGENLRYRAPKRSANAEALSVLARHKVEIRQILEGAPESASITPLSYNQRALWFLHALAPNSSAYNQSHVTLSAQRTNPAVWRAACLDLAKRHELLRTGFPERNGEPVQKIFAANVIDWDEFDLSNRTAEEQQKKMQAAHSLVFDLKTAPAARFRWFGLGENSALMVTMHHIITDGWSMEIIRRELDALYDEFAAGRTPAWLAVESSYRNYVWWQRDLLTGPEGERLWQYWRNRLNGPLPVLRLPLDKQRPAIQTYEGDACEFQLSDELVARLREMARTAGATLFASTLATWFVLLSRFSGQRDILVGIPTAGRTRAEFAGIVGYFVDPSVIRARLEEGQGFREFLRQVQTSADEALAHRDFPFALLVERLCVQRDPSRSPIFDVSFNYLNRRDAPEVDPATSGPLLRQTDGKFDLALTLHEEGAGIRGVLGYNTALFEPATVRQLVNSFLYVMEAAATNIDTPIEELPLTSGAAPVLLGRTPDPAWCRPVHYVFEEWAQREPRRPAVAAADETLTYGELDSRANRLARRLQQAGVRPGCRVGLSTRRTAGFVIGLLGILKAGGAYIPIAPEHPLDVRRQFLEQADAVAVVTEDSLASNWESIGTPLISTTDQPELSAEATGVEVEAQELAYIIYTSGSTGKPKGVAVEHRSLSNYAGSVQEDLGLREGASFAMVSTIGADLGNTAIFPALCSGGCLHIVPEDVITDGPAFAEYIETRAIDYLKIVPSHFAALSAAAGKLPLPRRALILGGEGASPKWVDTLQRSGCRVFNHYGPTETTIGVLTSPFLASDGQTASTLPLRTPIAGISIFLLDAFGGAVPQGFTGELAIGGVCVARGYVNDAKQTQEKFVRLANGQVIYKTGDRARQRSDGSLELLGRVDRQVGIRGFRIEPAHVESVLMEHPDVVQCVARPVMRNGEAVHLAAFCVCAPGSDASRREALAAEVRQLGLRKLPAYMAPERVVVLRSMPVTPNGKVDVDYLDRYSEAIPAELSSGRVLPRDGVEARLAAIWHEVLRVRTLGVRDDFFHLGGHSLLCVQMASKIHEEFGVRLPLAVFFVSRTIEQLAGTLRSDSAKQHSTLTPFRRSGRKHPLIFLPGAGGSCIYFHEIANHLEQDRPVWGLQAPGLNDGERITETVEEIAAHNIEILRRDLQAQGPYHLVGHSLGGLVAFEMARQLLAMPLGVGFVGIIDNAAPREVLSENRAGWSTERWLNHIAIRLQKLYRIQFQCGPCLTDDQLTKEMLRAGLLPPGTSLQYFRRFVEVYRRNAIAASNYVPKAEPLPLILNLFRAEEPDAELADEDSLSSDEDLGWSRWTKTPVRITRVPGTHITMMCGENAKQLAQELERSLNLAAPAQGD